MIKIYNRYSVSPIRMIFIILILVLSSNVLLSQNKKLKDSNYYYKVKSSYNYIAPADSLVKIKLEQWKKLKFGLMIHWGLYTVLGVIDSWTLCSDPTQSWIVRTGPDSADYGKYKKSYWNTIRSFNPSSFNPDSWSNAARNAGMKYVVFTTKHLDGFNMYDTQFSDFKTTDTSCPYNVNPKSNVAKEIFSSFRNQGFMVGAYYSKADWHNNDYWWRFYATPGFTVNYPPLWHTDIWGNYTAFVHNQITEILQNLGPIDFIELYASWVNKDNKDQNLLMDQLALESRSIKPDLIIADVGGQNYEDYIVSDIPSSPPDYPWECVMPLGFYWAYLQEDIPYYKSSDSLIHTLIEVNAKGGNFLLNIPPDKNGLYNSTEYSRLNEIGAWMNINSSSIYETKTVKYFKDKNIFFSRNADTTFASYLTWGNKINLPAVITWDSIVPRAGARIYMLGYSEPLSYAVNGKSVNVNIPEGVRLNPPCTHAVVFKFLCDSTVGNITETQTNIPSDFFLHQNLPNPFNPSTKIKFDIPKRADKSLQKVKIIIYDIAGREIQTLVNDNLQPGYYETKFDGAQLSSGVYFCRLISGDYISSIKMILIK